MFVTIYTTGSKSIMIAVVVVVVVVVVSQTIRCSEIVGGSDLIQFNINDAMTSWSLEIFNYADSGIILILSLWHRDKPCGFLFIGNS